MTNVTQIESYRPDEPKVPAIYRTIDQARAELEGPDDDELDDGPDDEGPAPPLPALKPFPASLGGGMSPGP